jgi:hypothetical protein
MKYLLTLVLALSVGCTSFPVRIASTPTYGVETVISTLIAIQDSAIDKEAQKEIPTSSARIVIKFAVDSLKTTKTVTDENTYKGLIDSDLTQVRKDLPVVDEAKFTGKFDFLHKILTQR